ncbi:MAG: hypothetical protein EOO73_08245 [Myxococcales bacterium]|nr:MAG: hypothetical protein EOO73_08245 [Myxococcales bacterium]
MTDEAKAPQRLSESSGAAGDLLRQVLSENASSAPLPRFTRLQERRSSRSVRQALMLTATAALALVIGARSLRPSEPPVTVRAEPVAQLPVSTSSAPTSEPPEELPALRHVPSEPLLRRDSPRKARPGAAGSAQPRVASDEPAPAAPQGPAEPLGGGAKPCAELARGGAVEPAMACYQKLADGAGVTAELALFEQARLAGKVLRQPARALRLLDTYQQRFPNGSLRAEVLLARIEWALASGDSSRATALVEEALASGLLRERAAELERLRSSLGSAPAGH